MYVVLGRATVSALLGAKTDTHASPPKVDEKDTRGQLVGDYMIRSSDEEREGA